jgi:hypothetical protein
VSEPQTSHIIDCFSGTFFYIPTMFLLNWMTAQPSFEEKSCGGGGQIVFGHHNIKVGAVSTMYMTSSERSLVSKIYPMRYLWPSLLTIAHFSVFSFSGGFFWRQSANAAHVCLFYFVNFFPENSRSSCTLCFLALILASRACNVDVIFTM